MITAKEALEKIQTKEEVRRELQEENERIRQAIKDGKYVPESLYTLELVEEEIYEAIESQRRCVAIPDKLKDSIVETLKENGYYCYLCKREDTKWSSCGLNIYYDKYIVYRTLVSMIANPTETTSFQEVKEL